MAQAATRHPTTGSRGEIAPLEGVARLDRRGALVEIDTDGHRLLNLDQLTKWRGAPFCNCFLASDREAASTAVDSALLGQPARFTARPAEPAGSERWCDVVISPGSADDPNPTARLRDVTELKQAERLLSAQQQVLMRLSRGEQLRAVLESLLDQYRDLVPEVSSGCVLAIDYDTRSLSVIASRLPAEYSALLTSASFPLTSWPPASFAGDLGNHATPENCPAELWRALRLIHPRPGLRYLWTEPIRASSGALLGFLLLCGQHTIEQREFAALAAGVLGRTAAIVIEHYFDEQQLGTLTAESDRERRLHEAAMAGTPDLVFITDPQRRIIYANRALLQFLKLPAAQVLGCTFREIARTDSLAELFEVEIERTLATGQPVRGDTPVETASGRRILDYILSPSYATSGDIEAVTGTVRDVTSRKRAEQDSERFRMLAESSTDFIAICDQRGSVVYLNPAGRQFLGLDERASLGALRLGSLLSASENEFTESTLYERVQRHGRAGFEVRLTDAGRAVASWVSCSVFPIGGPAGDQRSLGVVCRDITSRKAAEDALRQSEQRFRLALLGSSISVAESDGQLRYAWVANPLFGFSVEEMLGRRDEDLLSAASASRLAALKQRVLDTREPQRGVIDVTIAGHVRTFAVSIEPALTSGGQGVRMAAAEITRVRETEAALRDSEENFRTLADNIDQFAWMGDETGSLFWYNHRWFEYTGSTLEEMAGWGWQKVHHPDHVDRVVEKFRRHMESSQPWEDTFPLRAKDGTYRWFLSRARPIFDANGRVTRWFGTNTDVTEYMAVEARLREAIASAKQASETRDRFISVLSHELRTPLTPVLLAAAAIERDPSLPATVRRDAGMIRENVHLESKLIDDLLDINRIASGRLELRPEPVDLQDAVLHVCDMCRGEIAAKGLALQCSFDEGAVRVHGDAVRLQQVLWNLLKNAIKFTPPGGRISIFTERSGDICQVHVRDTGIGIPPDEIPRIFAAFEQADSSITRRFGGLGLGLAIARAIMELHGGAIRAESEGIGHGATFIVEMPALSMEAEAPVEVPLPEMATTEALRVLLVEDHPDTASMLSRALEFMGHSVAHANSAATALDYLAKNPVDLILSDIGLPDVDGFELMRQVRELYSTPAIALSGFGAESDLNRSRAAGFVKHLVKPLDIDTLSRTIQAALRESRKSEQEERKTTDTGRD